MGKLGERNDTWRLGRRPALDGLSLKLGNLLIVCSCAYAGFMFGELVAGPLAGLALTPVAGVLGYKYARETCESPE
jgi:hypothetical protein